MANNHWRKSQTEDFFIRDSKRKGLRSRSVYKLQEIDQRFKIFKNVQSVIDIGSCPGGWSVYSRKKIKSGITYYTSLEAAHATMSSFDFLGDISVNRLQDYNRKNG